MNQIAVAMPPRPSGGSFKDRLKARVVVRIATILAHFRPEHLTSVLRRIARGTLPANYEHAALARSLVCSVSMRCAGEGCLQRSIAIALLCRLDGRWPVWKAGVRIEPFRAHAWVEADGLPVEEGNDIEDYSVMLSVPEPESNQPLGTAGSGAT
jgi:hypothetical protein